MPLTPGSRIGSYEIAAQIGLGGMGEVYRATDTNLKRQVAIKVLPDAVAADAERLARFQREAEVLASLNHPNIAAIYGLERAASTSAGQAGMTALVMELVEGPTLADRIAQGAIPVGEALAMARQIAEALEAAHEQGIIHRDLKPANVKVRPDGTVKVLDFGLAKAMEPTGAISPGSSLAPTITTPAMTQAGLILGTAAYMSPEQAKGRPADRRSDIWSFGAVLFEMLSGRRAFEGEDVSDTMASVLKADTNWDALPGSVPPLVVTVIRRCLQRDPKQRLADVQDLRLALAGAFETPAPVGAAPAAAPAPPLWRRVLPAALALVAGAVVVGAAWALWPQAPAEVTRFVYRLPDGHGLRRIGRSVLAVSPDGRHVAYNTDGGIYLRQMDTLEARLIAGTEPDLAGPFFSPTGQDIAYYDFGARQIKRIGITGGAPVVVCDAVNNLLGAHWAPDGNIYFGQSAGIMSVPARGGEPELVVEAREGEAVYGPRLLPDGEGLLFTVTTATGATRWDEGQIVVASLATGERTPVVVGAEGRVLPTGHLVYALGSDLLAVPFDLRTRTTRGGAVSLVQGVRRAGQVTGAADYGVTDRGTLVYLRGEGAAALGVLLVLADETGELTSAIPDARDYDGARMSPDGQSLATVEDSDGEDQVWIIDLETGTRTQLTSDGTTKSDPVWTPDGLWVTFQSGPEILRQRVDGSAPAEVLVTGDAEAWPEDWSPDGQTLVFSQVESDGAPGLWTLSADRTATPFRTGPGVQTGGRFSPRDGAWIAFAQQGSAGTREIWVAPFPGPGTARQISSPDSGGDSPKWSADGQRLFYRGYGTTGSTGEVFASDVRLAGGFRRSTPEPLWDLNRPFALLDVHPSSQRFLLEVLPSAAPAAGEANAEIVFVQNWHEDVTRNVPAD